MNAAPKIIINNEAKIALREAYEFIKKNSFQNAEKMRTGILKSIEKLKKYPAKYPPDRFRRIKIFPFARMRFLDIE